LRFKYCKVLSCLKNLKKKFGHRVKQYSTKQYSYAECNIDDLSADEINTRSKLMSTTTRLHWGFFIIFFFGSSMCTLANKINYFGPLRDVPLNNLTGHQ